MTKKIIIISIIFTLLAAVSAFAQNAQELRIGSFINGNLGYGQEIWYRVTPAEAGILTVETSGNTDTYLEAYDAQQNILAENDDGGEVLNAKIELVAEQGKTYLFKLRGYDYNDTGPFRILASMRPLPVITELRIGASHDGVIASRGEYWYRVRAAQSGILTVETTGSTDTYIEVYTNSFEFIDADDDSGQNTNAKIEMDIMSGDSFLFKVTGYDEEITGAFRITAAIRNFPAPVPLAPGTFQSHNLSAGQEYWYSIRAPRRGRLIVETTGSTDTYMYAYSDTYELLEIDDDSGEGTNARIELNVEANQTYIFRLTGFGRTATGPFRIFASIE